MCPIRCSTFFSNDLIIIVVTVIELSSFTTLLSSSSSSSLSSLTTSLSSSSSCCHRIQRASNKSPSLQLNATSFWRYVLLTRCCDKWPNEKLAERHSRSENSQKNQQVSSKTVGYLDLLLSTGCMQLASFLHSDVITQKKTKVNKVAFPNQLMTDDPQAAMGEFFREWRTRYSIFLSSSWLRQLEPRVPRLENV